MMKRNSILFVFILLLSSVACTTTDNDTITSKGTVELTASTSSDTRVSMELSSTAIDLCWVAGDSFDVYSSDGTYVGAFHYSGAEGASSGAFTSAVDVEMDSGSSYIAYFPSKGAVIGLTSQVLTQSANSSVAHLNNSVIMSAYFTYNANGTSFVFSHEVAILGFEFELEVIPTKLVYTDGIGGVYAVNYLGGESDDYSIYVAVNPATSDSRGVLITVYGFDGSEYEFSKSVTAAHEAGNFYTPLITLEKLELTQWSVGDLVYNSSDVADGMIVWVNEDDLTQALALSFDIYDGVWDSNAPDAQEVALDDSAYRVVGAGDECQAVISNYSTYGESYEIFVWAQSLGEGWYIPTIYDWSVCIAPAFQNSGSWDGALDSGLNKMMTDAGGQCISGGLDISGTTDCIRYWTCNTSSTGAKARAFRLYDSNYSWTTFSFNSSTPYARAVKYIRL